jgi:two-component system NtrC family sensor kinase
MTNRSYRVSPPAARAACGVWLAPLTCLGLLLCMAAPRAVRARTVVSPDSLSTGDSLCVLAGGWRFHRGDDPAWADPGFDDSGWEVRGSLIPYDEIRGGEWPGVGWFRLTFEVDPDLEDQAFGLRTRYVGAIEIYLDGKRIETVGRVGAQEKDERIGISGHGILTPLSLRPGTHLLAVRFSNHWVLAAVAGAPDGHMARRLPCGFIIELGDMSGLTAEEAAWRNQIKSVQMFFTALPLAFAFLHLMLFLFYPALRANLYYAVFAVAMAAMAYVPIQTAIPDSFQGHLFTMALLRIALVFLAIFGLRFVYSVFYDRTPRQFWVFLFAGILLLLVVRYLPDPVDFVYGYVGLYLVEKLRVIVRAIVMRERGAWILGVGGAVFMTLGGLQMVADLGITESLRPELNFHVYGFAAFLVSMSVFLAREFARTHRDLEDQLVRVKELSDENLRAERKAKKRELARKILEKELQHKAKELEEARKLEQALRDLERANQELKDAQAQLVQSEKMASLGMLVAGVAHEINTPVGAIRSMYDTASRGIRRLKEALDAPGAENVRSDPKVQSALEVIDEASEVIRSGSERVGHIVKRLRSFARLDEAELKEADVREGLEDTLTLLHHELKQNIEVIREYGDVPAITCYPGQLNQVFLNLLVNARQAIGDEQGEIRIRTYHRDDRVFIEISDNGSGIPKAHLNKLFDPGFTTKGVGVGTGLGLSISYNIVRAHGGEIRVESEEGRGTTFTVVLPREIPAGRPPEGPHVASTPPIE